MALNIQLGLVTATFLFGGCGNMPPYRELFDTSPEAVGTGIAGVGLVRAVVIIAKYQATERQRQVAEQNARRAYQKIVARYQEFEAPKETSERPSRSKPVIAHKVPEPTPGPTPAPARPPQALSPIERPPKIPPYLAVDTVRDTRSKGEKSVMIWNTASHELISNEIYDLESTPRIMEKARFATHEARYIGAGNL